jgi:hypothetical protein
MPKLCVRVKAQNEYGVNYGAIASPSHIMETRKGCDPGGYAYPTFRVDCSGMMAKKIGDSRA